MGLRQMVDQAVDLAPLARRVGALEDRVDQLEGQPAPDAFGPTYVMNSQGVIEPEEAVEPLEPEQKGDLLSADATPAPGLLPVGEDGQVLTADSAAELGIEWEDLPEAGGGGLLEGELSEVSGNGSSELILPSKSGLFALLIGGGKGCPVVKLDGVAFTTLTGSSTERLSDRWAYMSEVAAGTHTLEWEGTSAQRAMLYLLPLALAGGSTLHMVEGAKHTDGYWPALREANVASPAHTGIMMGYALRADNREERSTLPVALEPNNIVRDFTFSAPSSKESIANSYVRGLIFTTSVVEAVEALVKAQWFGPKAYEDTPHIDQWLNWKLLY